MDVYLTQLQPVHGSGAKPRVVTSKLIVADDLKQLAQSGGLAVQSLPLRNLRSRAAPGFFCLSKDNLVEVSSSLSLSKYAEQQDKDLSDRDGGSGDSNKEESSAKDSSNDDDDDAEARAKDSKRGSMAEQGKIESQGKNAKVRQGTKVPGFVSRDLYVFWAHKSVSTQPKDVRGEVENPEFKLGDKSETPDHDSYSIPARSAALNTPAGIDIEPREKVDVPYSLKADRWAQVIEGNELLCAFQVDSELLRGLCKMKLSSLLAAGIKTKDSDPNTKPLYVNASGKDVTLSTNSDAIAPVRRCVRPLVTIRKDSHLGGHETELKDPDSTHAGLFWGNAKCAATTRIEKVDDSLQQWSLETGMSKKSVEAGIGLAFGKWTPGAKFGFEKEAADTTKTSELRTETVYTAIHEVPMAQINLNETTTQISPDAEADIEKIRRERNFSDLFTFLEKYGSFVFQTTTLGGRLVHTQSLLGEQNQADEEHTRRLKVSVNASLGISDLADLSGGSAYEKNHTTAGGKEESRWSENLAWYGIGGTSSLVVDPPRWRDSLNDYSSWRPIKYENPVRIDEFIGRLPGYSDVPSLFVSILASGVLNKRVIAIPPAGIVGIEHPSASDSLPSPLRVGMVVNAFSGNLAESGPKYPLTKFSDISSGGFLWKMIPTRRAIKREIRGCLQASLNPMVNITFDTPYLDNLKADETSFTVILRWNSRIFKEEKIQEQTPLEDRCKNYLHSMTERKTSHETERVEKETAYKKAHEEEQDSKKKEDLTNQFEQQKASREEAYEMEEVRKLLEFSYNIENKTPEGTALPDEKKEPWNEQFTLSSITSCAWLTAVWQITLPSSTKEQRETVKAEFASYFSQPRSIESGCDYICEKTDNNKVRARFFLHASDGPRGDERNSVNGSTALSAFNAIDQYTNNSSIHMLPIKAEIECIGNQAMPDTVLNETALMQIQTARTTVVLAKTCEPKDVPESKRLVKPPMLHMLNKWMQDSDLLRNKKRIPSASLVWVDEVEQKISEAVP